MKKRKKRSVLSLAFEWAGKQKSLYVASVICAAASVLCKLIPYYFIGRMINDLIAQVKEPAGYIRNIVLTVLFFIASELMHQLSTSMSHRATFVVLANVRKKIAGFWDVKNGEIDFGGVKSSDLSTEDLRKLVSYVSQDNYLFDETIRENIRQGNPLATDEQVEEIARQSGCYDFIMSLPEGFDTVTGSGGGHLSGGEKQRISIARAMLKNAPIIILDEATAYTDPENEAMIERSIASLIKGKTLIMIAHRLKTVRNADTIVVIDKGRIAEQGRHDELIAKDGLYRNFIRTRQEAVNWRI